MPWILRVSLDIFDVGDYPAPQWMQKVGLAQPVISPTPCPQLPGWCIVRVGSATEEFFHLRVKMKTNPSILPALFTLFWFYLPKV